MLRFSVSPRARFVSTTALGGSSRGLFTGLLASCCLLALPQVAWADGQAISDPSCPANPGAVINNGGATGGLAISGAMDCPAGTTPSAQVNDPGGIAIGDDRSDPTTTNGDGGSIAIGNGAQGGDTGKSNATAIGTDALALGTDSAALGSGSTARADKSVAIGSANAISTGSVAIGTGATTGDVDDLTRVNQVAIGNGAAATAQNSIAIGQGSVANGPQATAIGSLSSAGVNSTATGRKAVAGNSAVAYGVNANAGLRGTALGQGAVASAADSTAVGSFASATVANSVALGRNSTAIRGAQTNYIGYGLSTPQTSVGEVAIGTAAGQRQLTGVAAGSAATDAVNVSQLTAVDAESDTLGIGVATALGGGASYDSATGTLMGPSYTVQGSTQTTVGGALSALDTQVTTNSGDIATNIADIAANTGDIATNTAHIATNTTNITNLSTGIGNGTLGIVQQAAPGADLTVGAATDGAAVSFTGTDGNRRLVGVAAGDVSTASTDAINGSQLYAGNSSLAVALGGGATVNADGTVRAPSYAVQGTTQNNVGDALNALDTQVTTNTTNVAVNTADIASNTGDIAANTAAIATNAADIATNSTDIATNTADIAAITTGVGNGTVGLVQQAAPGADLTVGTATNGAAVNFAGTAGDRRLTGVAAGAVSAASAEAINGSQLYAGNASVSSALGGGATVNADGTVSVPSYAVQGTTQNNVGGALTALDTQVTANTGNIATNITNIAANSADINDLADAVSSGSIGLVQQSAPGATLTVGGATDGAAINFAGTAGDRRLTGVGAGAVSDTSTEAINGSQLAGTAQSTAAALGGGASVNADGTIAAPSYVVQGVVQTNVGDALSTLDTQLTTNTGDIATNTTNIATNTSDIADLASGIGNGTVGLVQQAAPGQDLTVGAATDGAVVHFAGTAGDRQLDGVAAGLVSVTSSVAINGSQLYAGNASLAAALGGGATVSPDGTVSAPTYMIQGAARNNVGDALTALDDQVTTNTGDIATLTDAIGNGSLGLVQQAGSAAQVTVAAATGGSSVNFAGTDGDRVLTGIATGAVAANSTDAVNGGQLAGNAQSVASALGGSAAVNADGTISAPTYAIQGGTQTSVGGALTALDGQVTTNTAAIAGIQSDVTDLGNAINNGTAGLVQQAAAGAPLTVGASTDGGSVDFAGTGGDRVLTGVADGVVSATSTDVVNGSQLNATNQEVENIATLVTSNGDAFVSNNSAGTGVPQASGTESAAGGNGAVASGQQSTAVGNNTTASGAQSTAVGYAASATGSNSVALGAGSTDEGEDNVVSVGSSGDERRVTNVAMGVNQTDAVNVGQLNNAMGQTLLSANAYTDRRFNDLAYDIGSVRRDNEGATASAMALAGIPQSFEPGMGMVGMGVGTWQGESAVAMGISKATDSGRVVFKAGATYSSRGQAGANGGVGFAF